MELRQGRLRLSPSDVSGFLACPHLTQLELAVARGERARPVFDDPHRAMLRQKGHEHESAYLAGLEAQGRSVARIRGFGEHGFDADQAARLTEEAIQAGAADVIYQPYLRDERWHGFADFLERLPDGTYEPVDTKLARTARPEHVLQLSFYAEQLERIQRRRPAQLHVQLGSGRRESFRTEEYAAYHRRARGRFLEAVESSPPTYPWRCDRCPICSWRRECHARLETDDSLVLVAGLRKSYVEPFAAHGITTLAQLGDASPRTPLDGFHPGAYEALRHQAELQLHRRRTGEHRFEPLPLVAGRG